MALAIDASTPAIAAGAANATSITSAAFSPPANSVIVVCVLADGPGTTVQSVSGMTDNLGSHLGWALITGSQGNESNAALGGCTEIWYASCPSAQTSMTVTATFAHATSGGHSPDSAILPIVFTGAATTQNGAANHFVPASPAVQNVPTLNVTTTAANSWVIGCVQNYDSGTGPTVGTNQTDTINGHVATELNATDGDAYWVQIQTATTPSSGTVVTINDTAPSVRHNMSVVEVLAATGGSSPTPLVCQPVMQAVNRASTY